MGRFLANPLEPRTGLEVTGDSFRVDARIGSDWEIRQWRGGVPGFDRVSVGLGAAALLLLNRHVAGLLPDGAELDSGEYYAGLFAVGERAIGTTRLQVRILRSHISSHAGDGLYDRTTGEWEAGMDPVDYSRDSIHLTAAVLFAVGLRVYLEGITTSFHGSVDRGKSPRSFRAGAEFRWPREAGTRPFAAIDLRSHDVASAADGPLGVNAVAGVRVGGWDVRGAEARVSYYSGPNWRGQLVDRPMHQASVGLLMDF